VWYRGISPVAEGDRFRTGRSLLSVWIEPGHMSDHGGGGRVRVHRHHVARHIRFIYDASVPGCRGVHRVPRELSGRRMGVVDM